MPPNEVTLELLDYRVSVLEADRQRFLTALETLILLGETLRTTQKSAEQLGHWLETVDKRVQALEVAAPILSLTSHWVMAGVLGILSLVGMGFWGMFMSYRQSL